MWEPVLSGALADSARAAIREIAAALPLESGRRTAVEDTTLVFAYATSLDDDPELARRYDDAIAALVARIASGALGSALFFGLAGARCVLAHVANHAEDVLAASDRALLDELAQPSSGSPALVAGIPGIGVHFLVPLISAPPPTV